MFQVQDWTKAGMALWLLSAEAAVVISLRSWRIAGGGAIAATEMHRMVTEKMAAGLALQAMALRGGMGKSLPDAIDRSARYYGKRVRANRRRLTKI